MNTQQVLDYPPPPPDIPYHMLSPDDPAVLKRIPVWASYPTAFCREAMNFFPHWYQDELINDMSIFIAACWSRQIGKSEAIAHKAIHEAFTNEFADVIIIAPVKRQARELFTKITKAITQSPIIFNSVVGRMTQESITFDNGSRIINLAAGDEGVQLRGYSIALLIIEEAAFIPEAVFVAVEQGLSSTGGREIMISTPYGKNNEFYKVFHPEGMKGYDHSKMGRQQVGEFSCYRYDYTVGLDVQKPNGRPQLSQIHVDRQKRKLTDFQWRAEYLAEFIEDIDQYFPQGIIEALYNSKFFPSESPKEGSSYFFGIDIAKGGNYTAISIGEILFTNPITGKPLTHPHIQIVKRVYWKMKHIGAQYPLFIQLVEIWQPIKIFFDKTSLGERPFEELQEVHKLPVEGVNFSGLEKASMYGNLTVLMSMDGEIEGWKKRIQTYPDPEAKSQYEAMVYEVPEQKTKVGGKRLGDSYKIYAARGHDDIPDADALLSKAISTKAEVQEPKSVKKNAYRRDRDEPTRDEKVQNQMARTVNNRSKRWRGGKHPKVFW